ncbi:FAD binding domain protein [Paraburkholderia xenovorans LB400]|uniref:FAD dependent oxidoreductase n=1 Tax=Paraburkholderia xenovorans (strain LB400) TaxID=266265 RepID=Q13H31_PARXL|nr:FAD-binding oxidoreductase [Paraburkholderia xenovorans]ABE36608.1 Putative FAD dependent oxidoreductase [Paraburkholderia xenovorans LB400]AIP34503.1 FAD binding domain protein [Paraburkholderia xenovorans LB400]
MKLDSYWLDTAPRFTKAAQGPLPQRVDVAVVGGGFTGLSAALELAKRGMSVVVFEAGRLAAQASGRNGGHCNTGVAQDYAALSARIGSERASEFYRAYAGAVDTVKAIIAEEQIDCDLRHSGKIKLAAKPQHFASLANSYEVLKREVDPDVELVPPERIRDEIGSDGFFGGLVQRNGMQMHMGKFGVGLGEAAARRGAQIYENTPITNLKALGGNAFEVSSPLGTLRAERVLIATGASQVGPLQWFRRRIAPVGSFIVATEPLGSARLDALLPTRRSYVTTLNIGNYFRATPDERLLFGGRARFAMSNPRSDEKSGHILRDALARYFPQLADVGIDYCWGGLVDMTADRLPRAGQHEGLFYSMGYSGHGVQMSVHMGRLMADVMFGAASRNPWRTLEWPAIPGHFGRAWFLPLVGAYYRLQDVLH